MDELHKSYTTDLDCAVTRINAAFSTNVTIQWGWITFRVKPENHYATLSDVKTADICGGAGAAMTKDPRSISRRKNLMNERVVEKILVVSENQELCLFLRSEVKKHIFDRPLKIDFCYTSSNQDPKKMVEMGATKINVKDELTIDFIVSRYDLVFSLHCKQIFPNRLVENVRCVNFHPGLNPYNRGWYPQAFSIINGLPAGATIHLMDAEVDHGDIIAQKTVSIEPSDTSYEVYRKVISAEKYLIKKNIRKIIEGAYYSFAPKKDGNYNSVKDYRKICELQLDSVDTLQSHINLLRATTHGAFKNAFFVDKNGLKYYVKISIERA